MASIVLSALGSWGDIFPLLGVAHELRQRGESVAFATAPAFTDLVEAEGFENRPVGPPLTVEDLMAHPELLDSRLNGLMSLRKMFDLFVRPHLDRLFVDVCEAVQGADVLAAHPSVLPAPLVSESTGVPFVSVSIAPGLLPSRFTVPQGNPLPALPGRIGALLNRTAWRLSFGVLRRLFDEPLLELRRLHGLPEKRDAIMSAALSPTGTIVLSSPLYTPRQPDWPSFVRLVGFVTWDGPRLMREGARLAPSPGAAPQVLVTGGASTSLAPESFFEMAAEALDRLGLEGVFLVGFEKNVTGVLRAREHVLPFAPLSSVLPYVTTAVHHGGIGTTASVLRSGVPSVVVPRAFDQFFHARRVQELGTGYALPWPRLTVRRVARYISNAVENARIRSKAIQIGEALRSEGDGAGRAAAEIVSALERLA